MKIQQHFYVATACELNPYKWKCAHVLKKPQNFSKILEFSLILFSLNVLNRFFFSGGICNLSTQIFLDKEPHP